MVRATPRVIGSVSVIFLNRIAKGLTLTLRNGVRWSYQLMKECIRIEER